MSCAAKFGVDWHARPGHKARCHGGVLFIFHNILRNNGRTIIRKVLKHAGVCWINGEDGEISGSLQNIEIAILRGII